MPVCELAGVYVSLLLFGGGEAAFFAAADALVGGHAFKEELGGGDGDFGLGFGGDVEGGELVEEALDLLELLEGGGGGLLVVELDGAAEVEPLLDLLGVDGGEVLVEDVGDGLADDLAGRRCRRPSFRLRTRARIFPVMPGRAA